jgi:conjugative relaxase-like TrwC/TraI family protein
VIFALSREIIRQRRGSIMTGTIVAGHDADYYTKGGTSRDAYYTGGATQGEPPGRWFAVGANSLGLTGNVSAEAMKALYTQGLDPRDPRFWSEDPQERAQCDRLGKGPRAYKSRDELVVEKLVAAGRISDGTLGELRAMARAAQGSPEHEGESEQGILVGLLTAEGGLMPEQVNRMKFEAERQTRQSVAFLDATYSPPKSVTVYHTALARSEFEAEQRGDLAEAARYRGLREDVEESLYEAAEEFVEHLYDRAGYARVGRHGSGAGRWERSEGWTVAQFLQHTSRDGDPQLHVHGAILSKQVCADGQVRALDTALIMANKQGAGTIADVALSQGITRRHAERGVGVHWKMRADGVGRELDGVDQESMDLFSKRTANMGPKLAELVDEYRELMGREPNALELSRLSKQASLGTRKAKHATDGLTRAEQLEKWDGELRKEVVTGLTTVAARVAAGQVPDVPAEEWSPSGVIAEAVAACQEKRAAWSRTELERQIGLALPDNLGTTLGRGQVRKLIGQLADEAVGHERVVQVSGQEMTGEALPNEFRLQTGASSYVNPASARYATEGHVVAEQAVRRASIQRDRLKVTRAEVDEWISDRGQTLGSLGEDQRAAVVGLLTSGANVAALIGPAGAGKSFTMGATSAAWQDLTGRKVVGIATSEAATQVLRGEGLNARNSAQWLQVQERIASGRATRDDLAWTVEEGDMIVVDEAAMVDHTVIERVREIVEHRGARLVMTGDPAQIGAIGAGGTMAMVAATEGADVYTLTSVRRFAAPWEREASLRLRSGDLDVVEEYDRRGRIVDCGTVENAERQAATSYVAEHLAGNNAVVVVRTNEGAARVSSMVRTKLVDLGAVQADGMLLRDGTTAGVGDLIQARRNDWNLGVTNRRRYRVTEVREDGSIVGEATDGSGSRVMPESYVIDDVTLGYAGTAHAVQGLTVDVCDPVIDSKMSMEALYMALTRGKLRNTARVATQPEVDGELTGETHARDRLTGTGVIRDILERGISAEDAAMTQAEQELAEHGNNRTIHARHEDVMRHVARVRTAQWLDELAAEGVLSDADRVTLAADQGTEQLGRLLRTVEQAGHDPREALRAACEKPFVGLRSIAQGVQGRIKAAYEDDLKPGVEQMEAAAPAGLSEAMGRYVGRLAEMADDRRRELGSQVAEVLPQWAFDSLGPVPDDVVGRMEWERKAGIVAAHREATGHDDEASPLPAAPGLSSTELRASWHAAWTALGRPEAGSEERDLSDGLLRVRARAWEREQAWAPKYVDDEMRATGQKVVEYRQAATVLERQADLTTDPDEAARLRAEAADKAAQAEVMGRIEADLSHLADQRAEWFAETAVTRVAAERAILELDRRGQSWGDESDRVTAEEWLQLHDESMRAEDPHRDITETDAPEVWDPQLGDVVQLPDSPEHGPDRSELDTGQDVGTGADQGDGIEFVEVKFADEGDDMRFVEVAFDDAVPETASSNVADDEFSTTEVVEATEEAEETERRVADKTLPEGVPELDQVEIALAAARRAALVIADRRSAELARIDDDAEEAERQEAWRRDEELEAEAELARDDADRDLTF